MKMPLNIFEYVTQYFEFSLLVHTGGVLRNTFLKGRDLSLNSEDIKERKYAKRLFNDLPSASIFE